jgi:hypothetical protein
MRARVFLLFALAVLVFVFFGGPVWADWNPGDPYKWVQLPDLRVPEPGVNPYGIDVDVTDVAPPGIDPPGSTPRVVADDFLCTSHDLITDIHIWGSWKYNLMPDNNPNNLTFRLSIHSDIPANVQDQYGNTLPWSRPGDLLWERYFSPGSFIARQYATNPEGWYDPVQGTYIPVADDICWQYNFLIPPQNAFLQQGTSTTPIIYWLDVDAIVPQNPMGDQWEFGWKSSYQHWNDDGTYRVDSMPIWMWEHLQYPYGHPLYGDSIDLAFVITPEPSAIIMLLGAGLIAVLGWMRIRRK